MFKLAHALRPAIVPFPGGTRCFSTGLKAAAWTRSHLGPEVRVTITEARPPAPTWSLRDQSEDR